MRRFDLNCVVRVLLLSGSIGLLAYLLFKTEFVAASIFLALMIVYQIFSLIRFVTKTNRDLNRFLLSIKHSDFSQSFTTRLEGSGFEELNTAFSEVTREFQRAKIEKEEHFRFLQTIIDHVGIALIAFNPDGRVELINNAAKKLLKIPRLGNIRDI
ncbi:MAG: ATP-binding protein, partial [Deltaproteobacteria bacterium]|nr:ATP-binding protein [Deltaproteobacteria bacterium]